MDNHHAMNLLEMYFYRCEKQLSVKTRFDKMYVLHIKTNKH